MVEEILFILVDHFDGLDQLFEGELATVQVMHRYGLAQLVEQLLSAEELLCEYFVQLVYQLLFRAFAEIVLIQIHTEVINLVQILFSSLYKLSHIIDKCPRFKLKLLKHTRQANLHCRVNCLHQLLYFLVLVKLEHVAVECLEGQLPARCCDVAFNMLTYLCEQITDCFLVQ